LGGANLLDAQEALDVISLLQFLAEPADNIPLVAILRSPFFAITDNALYDAGQKVDAKAGVTWWEVIDGDPAFSRPVAVLRELLAERNRLTAAEIVSLADTLTGY